MTSKRANFGYKATSRLQIAALALGAACLAPLPAAAEQESFVMPSGNIECTYTGPAGTSVYRPAGGVAELVCDRMEPTYLRVEMRAKGAVRVIRNVADPSCCGVEPKLGYGNVWRQAPFTCESSPVGVICRRDDGAGFQLSRKGVSLE